jgi:hypothetical protein
LFVFTLFFGGSILAWVDRQVSQCRKHQQKMAELKLETAREEAKHREKQMYQIPKEEHSPYRSYDQGYEGEHQEIEISYHQE